ncbi:MAG: hypothetical protein ACE5RN_04125 [Nitrosopumilaceae archaeon]
MPASAWDPYNWFNWYWWLPDNTNEEKNSSDESTITEKIQSEEVSPSEEIIIEKKSNKDKPKTTRKKRTYTKKVSTKTQDAIELILRPSILEELEKEAIITDSTINQVIQVILEAHIESKGASNLQTEVWKCNFCSPDREFRDYFEFSEHFFNEHMQPGLQKISDFQIQEK